MDLEHDILYSKCARAVARVPREAVWEVITDVPGYVNWSGTDEAEIIKPGETAPSGLGAIRVVRARHDGLPVPIEVSEVINHYWEPYLFGYRIIAGPTATNHQGIILLNEHPDGTEIAYHISCTPLVEPELMAQFLGEMAVGHQNLVILMAQEAERRAPRSADESVLRT